MTDSALFSLQKVLPGQLRTEQLQGFFVGWPDPPSSETLLKILEQSYLSAVILHKDSKQVLAFINCISDGILSCYIPLLEVLPEFQGQGFGGQLVQFIKEECQEFYGLDILCDPELIPFYSQFGFKKASGVLSRNYQAQSGRLIS